MLVFMWILCISVTVLCIIPIIIGVVKQDKEIILPFLLILILLGGVIWGALGNIITVRSESKVVECSIVKTETAVVIEYGSLRGIKEDIKTYNSVVNGKEKCKLVKYYNMYNKVIERTISLIEKE